MPDFDMTLEDNWMHVVRAERLLGRPLTDDERRDVLKHGSRAACVEAYWPFDEQGNEKDTPER